MNSGEVKVRRRPSSWHCRSGGGIGRCLRDPKRLKFNRVRRKLVYLLRGLLTACSSSLRRLMLYCSRGKVSNYDPAGVGYKIVNNRRRRRRSSSTNRNNAATLRSYARSNSFYAEAIADCLDFIKRNSVSSEELILPSS